MVQLDAFTEQFPKLSAYELHYLVEHLALIDRPGETRKLLTLETSSGHNFWYGLKLAQGLIDSYFEDLRIAGAMEEGAIANLAGQNDTTLAFVVRYAGMKSSLVQRASNVPSPLLRQLALQGLWSPERCFHHALNLATPKLRFDALCAIFSVLDRVTRQSCFEYAIESIRRLDQIAGNDTTLRASRRDALGQLCKVLTEAGETQLLITLCGIDASWIADQPTAWILAGYLADACNDESTVCIDTAHNLIQATTEGSVMVAPALYGLLTELERQHVWSSVQSHIGEDPFFIHHLIEAVLAIARWKPSTEMVEAIDLLYAQIIEESIDDVRVAHLAKLIPLLAEDALTKAKNEVLHFVSRGAGPDYALEDLISELCEHDVISWNEIRAAVHMIPTAYLRWKVLAVAMGALPYSEAQRELRRALEYIENLSKRDAFSAEVLLESIARAAPKMEIPLLKRFLDQIFRLCNGKYKMRALAGVAPHLSPNELRTATEVVLETPIETFATTREEEVERFFDRAAPLMDGPLLADSLQRLETRRGTIFSEGYVTNMLRVLGTTDRHDFVVQALRESPSLPIGQQVNLLNQLAPFISDDESLQKLAVSVATTLDDDVISASVLCSFAREISEKALLDRVRHTILEMIHKLTDPRSRAMVIARALIAFSDLGAGLYGWMIDSIRLVPHPTNRAEILAALPNGSTADRLRHALVESVLAGEREAVARDVLRELAPVLTLETLELIFSDFEMRPVDDYRLQALPALAGRLTHFGLTRRAYDLVVGQQQESIVADGIEAIAHDMDHNLLDRACIRVRTISKPYSLDLATSAICIRAAELGVMRPYFDLAVAIADPGKRARTLLTMAKEHSDLQETLLEEGMKAVSLLNPVLGTSVTLDIQAAFLNCLRGSRLAAKLAELIRVNGEQERSHFVGRLYSLAGALASAGGPDVLPATAAAIRDICRWWP